MIQKNDSYYKNSLDVAREFVQSVTIVDDKATYSGEGPVSSESFNAGEIIKKFSEEGIVCSVYKFTEESDIDRIARISRRSDVTILDWKMNPIPGMPSASDDDETEDDERESKGYYTLEILKKVVSGEYNKFKLFVIYTDEIEFNRIIDEIKKVFTDADLPVSDDGSPYSFRCNSNKITIFGKEAIKTKAKHVKDIAERSFSYTELPDAVYDEFVRFTHGVVSNIFLKSVSAIRANTFFLLNTFQRGIDPAFIAHKCLLPVPDDAHDLIVELIGSEIKSVIGGALSEAVTNKQIEGFVDTLDSKQLLFNFDRNGLNKPEGIPESFSTDDFKKLLKVGLIPVCKYEDEPVRSKIDLSRKVVKHLPQIILKGYDSGMKKEDVQKAATDSNVKFACLTTLKKRYLNSSKPILTLGVVLKSKTVSGTEEYWICIQPKCDSVRLTAEEDQQEGRPFMFLSLAKASGNGDIILDSKSGFKIMYSIIKSRQFMFRSTKNGTVQVEGEGSGHWFFKDSSGKCFEYLGELKNDFAQGIANNFASQVSRVATNHSEWLRLNSMK